MTTIRGLAACTVLESSQLGSLAHSFIKKSSKTPDDRLVSSLTRKICVVKSGMGKQPSRGDLCPRVPDDHTRSGSVGSVRLCSRARNSARSHALSSKRSKTPDDRLVSSPTRKICVVKEELDRTFLAERLWAPQNPV